MKIMTVDELSSILDELKQKGFGGNPVVIKDKAIPLISRGILRSIEYQVVNRKAQNEPVTRAIVFEVE